MLIPCVCAIVYVFSNYGCTKFWPKHQALIKVLIDFSFSQLPIVFVPVFDNFDGILYMGHSCKIGNMRCPGTLKNQNPQFEEKK